jgi:uncharacterized protein YecE (DUF72 family)
VRWTVLRLCLEVASPWVWSGDGHPKLTCGGGFISARLRIGTSGWHYRHWKGNFYPADFSSAQYLSWYVRHFKTVEINNCFYRLPPEAAVERWREETPADFCFAVKGSRFITHIKRLRDPEAALATYLSRMEILKGKLGPILFQLPPNWHMNPERLQEFLLAWSWKKHQCVFEFRDPTWYTPEIYELLGRHNVALCLHDWRGEASPVELTADFTYLRFHGASGKYQGNYTAEMLAKWAELIRDWLPKLRDIYVYFNNDQGGYAVKNAQLLQSWFEEGTDRLCA